MYKNENNYIASHVDCQKGMLDNSKIAILTLNEYFIGNNDSKNIRYLEITSKYKKYQSDNESLANIFKIKLYHKSIITMCEMIQDNFLYEIKKFNLDDMISIDKTSSLNYLYK